MKLIPFPEIVHKTIDALVIAPLNGRDSVAKNLKTLIQLGGPNYNKVVAFINLVNRAIPGISRKVSEYLMCSSKLPLSEGRLTLLNIGSGSTVFRYRTVCGDYVVKFSRSTLGIPLEKLLKVGREHMENHNRLTKWYNGKYSLVLSSHFIVTRCYILDSLCFACLQTYLHGRQEDLLRDFDDEQIVYMMKQNWRLCDQFVHFIRATLQAIESEGLCLDMLGNNNLMLLTSENVTRLLLVDYGIFNLDNLARNMPDKLKLVNRDIQRLKSLALRIS